MHRKYLSALHMATPPVRDALRQFQDTVVPKSIWSRPTVPLTLQQTNICQQSHSHVRCKQAHGVVQQRSHPAGAACSHQRLTQQGHRVLSQHPCMGMQIMLFVGVRSVGVQQANGFLASDL